MGLGFRCWSGFGAFVVSGLPRRSPEQACLGSGTTVVSSVEGGGPGFPAIWEFPKIRGTLFWGPYNKDPTTYLGYYIRVPYFRKLPFGVRGIWSVRGKTGARSCWFRAAMLVDHSRADAS